MSEIQVRPARVDDAKPILTLVNELALKQVMLPRSPASVIENIRDFLVAEVDGKLAGCGALAITWTDLAEIRSLAVAPAEQKRGVGRALVDALVADAERLGLPRLFAFTYVPGFFTRVGFEICQHEDLPHKVFNDCRHCPKFLACDEIAMTRVIDAEASPAHLFGKPQRAIPLPQRTPSFRAPSLAPTPAEPPPEAADPIGPSDGTAYQN
ncbi:MAG: N-acetyltransferase [Planctomycetes bacterium]|nr:N-acetyltransferase [Planctomycetota bacterium]